MAQEQKDISSLPGAGEGQEAQKNEYNKTTKSDAEHRVNVMALLQAKGVNTISFADMSTLSGASFSPTFTVPSEATSGLSYNTGFANVIEYALPGTSLISAFGESSSNAVQRAQEKLKKAQQELQEALDVEQAMLELAQLREVRKLHEGLYGPDKDSHQTAAQQYLAFKASQREQPA